MMRGKRLFYILTFIAVVSNTPDEKAILDHFGLLDPLAEQPKSESTQSSSRQGRQKFQLSSAPADLISAFNGNTQVNLNAEIDPTNCYSPLRTDKFFFYDAHNHWSGAVHWWGILLAHPDVFRTLHTTFFSRVRYSTCYQAILANPPDSLRWLASMYNKAPIQWSCVQPPLANGTDPVSTMQLSGSPLELALIYSVLAGRIDLASSTSLCDTNSFTQLQAALTSTQAELMKSALLVFQRQYNDTTSISLSALLTASKVTRWQSGSNLWLSMAKLIADFNVNDPNLPTTLGNAFDKFFSASVFQDFDTSYVVRSNYVYSEVPSDSPSGIAVDHRYQLLTLVELGLQSARSVEMFDTPRVIGNIYGPYNSAQARYWLSVVHTVQESSVALMSLFLTTMFAYPNATTRLWCIQDVSTQGGTVKPSVNCGDSSGKYILGNGITFNQASATATIATATTTMITNFERSVASTPGCRGVDFASPENSFFQPFACNYVMPRLLGAAFNISRTYGKRLSVHIHVGEGYGMWNFSDPHWNVVPATAFQNPASVPKNFRGGLTPEAETWLGQMLGRDWGSVLSEAQSNPALLQRIQSFLPFDDFNPDTDFPLHQITSRNNLECLLTSIEGFRSSFPFLTEFDNRVRVRFGHTTWSNDALAQRMRNANVWVDISMSSNLATLSYIRTSNQFSQYASSVPKDLLCLIQPATTPNPNARNYFAYHGLLAAYRNQVNFLLGTDASGVERSRFAYELGLAWGATNDLNVVSTVMQNQKNQLLWFYSSTADNVNGAADVLHGLSSPSCPSDSGPFSPVVFGDALLLDQTLRQVIGLPLSTNFDTLSPAQVSSAVAPIVNSGGMYFQSKDIAAVQAVPSSLPVSGASFQRNASGAPAVTFYSFGACDAAIIHLTDPVMTQAVEGLPLPQTYPGTTWKSDVISVSRLLSGGQVLHSGAVRFAVQCAQAIGVCHFSRGNPTCVQDCTVGTPSAEGYCSVECPSTSSFLAFSPPYTAVTTATTAATTSSAATTSTTSLAVTTSATSSTTSSTLTTSTTSTSSSEDGGWNIPSIIGISVGLSVATLLLSLLGIWLCTRACKSDQGSPVVKQPSPEPVVGGPPQPLITQAPAESVVVVHPPQVSDQFSPHPQMYGPALLAPMTPYNSPWPQL